jgi:hypothetical protein
VQYHELKLRINKPLRNLGVYILHDKTLILLRRSDEISFLFSEHNWHLHGPVDYRVSHGGIYRRGHATVWTDEDLFDTGVTAKPSNGLMPMDAEHVS